MKRLLTALAATSLFAFAGSAMAQEYNTVPAGDAQYKQCLVRVNKLYEGGDEKSPIAGQNKAQAYCTCLWNETPDDFKGSAEYRRAVIEIAIERARAEIG